MHVENNTYDKMIAFTLDKWQSNSFFIKLINYLKYEKIRSYIDLGANLGDVCYILNYYIPTLKKAFLFEPQMDNYAFMQERFKKDENIKCFNFGIYYGKFMSPLYRKIEDIGLYSIVHDEFSQSVGETIILKPLENLNLPLVDFVKIDVVGAENNIIKNSSYLKNIKYISVRNYSDSHSFNLLYKKYLPNHYILFNDDINYFFVKKTFNTFF